MNHMKYNTITPISWWIMTRNLIVAVLSFGLLAGCDDDKTPSVSRIQTEISATAITCPLISVENFQKVNGMLQNDGTYIATVTYTVLFSAVTTNRTLWTDFVQAYTPLKALYDADSNGPAQLSRSDAEEAAYKANMDEAFRTSRKIDALVTTYHTKMAANFHAQCQTIPYGYEYGAVKDYGRDRRFPFRLNYTFIHTDNGWVLAARQ